MQDYVSYKRKARRKEIKLLLRSSDCLLGFDFAQPQRSSPRCSEPRYRAAAHGGSGEQGTGAEHRSARHSSTSASSSSSGGSSRGQEQPRSERAHATTGGASSSRAAREPLTAADFCEREASRHPRARKPPDASDSSTEHSSRDGQAGAASASADWYAGREHGRHSSASRAQAAKGARRERAGGHERKHRRTARRDSTLESEFLRDFFASPTGNGSGSYRRQQVRARGSRMLARRPRDLTVACTALSRLVC